jgi:hypothetical protein
VGLDAWLYLILIPLYVLLVEGGGADEQLAQASVLKTS